MAHVCHRPEFAEKCVYLVATTGTSPTKHTIRTLQGAFLSWGAYLVGWSGFKMGAKMDSITAKIRYQNECSKIARHLFLAIQNRRFIKPSIFSLMVFKTQQWFYRRLKDDSVDYSYWYRNGWTDPNQEFFIPHQSNRLTVTFARLMGTLLAVLWA